MKTKKPFSTVSYNTAEWLVLKLSELHSRRIIDFWAFVYHFKEEDESKDHIHLFIIPNGQQDTDQLRDYLEEPDPNNPLKPLGCMPFRSSKWDDWKQYCDHDERYLTSKGQWRKHHYNNADYSVSDEQYFNELNHQIDRSKLTANQVIIDAVRNNIPFSQLLMTGQIPVQLITQYRMMYDLVYDNEIKRKYDEETGEMVRSHTPKDEEELPF